MGSNGKSSGNSAPLDEQRERSECSEKLEIDNRPLSLDLPRVTHSGSPGQPSKDSNPLPICAHFI